uniref:Putative ovule protein n=1 Tax=Solanum chacoense TaxID=4108 RepID=A0A0V0IPY9_SOLCH
MLCLGLHFVDLSLVILKLTRFFVDILYHVGYKFSSMLPFPEIPFHVHFEKSFLIHSCLGTWELLNC